ncbi:helix-turn-helix transcriptional regulator [Fontibacillus sp. BL9]|uniref:helix-turn-helix transcriptional regulator n=1 Tax=Fontibacillus sp. BL9 TaxID=3389971 RepID=UPI003979FF65
MCWTTIGKRFYPGYHHQMQVRGYDELVPEKPIGNRYRFILADEGGGALQIGGQFYSVTAPSIIYVNEEDGLFTLSGSRIKARSIYFHPQIINWKYEFPMMFDERKRQEMTVTDLQDLWCLCPFTEKSGVIPIDPMYAKHISQILTDIERQLGDQPDDGWPCRSRSYMMELLALIRRLYDHSNSSSVMANSLSNEQIAPVVRFLHTHYRNKIKIEDVTRAFHTNKTSLNLQFKQAVGQTMMSYLNSIRMQMAAAMLRNTTLSANEIMHMVGIQDSGHFIRNFRKYTGFSPSEYRSRFCWMLKP